MAEKGGGCLNSTTFFNLTLNVIFYFIFEQDYLLGDIPKYAYSCTQISQEITKFQEDLQLMYVSLRI